MKCIICGKEFETERSTARFCSNTCKLAYHRSKVSVSKEPQNDTLRNAKNDTLRNENGTLRYGFCKYCGKELKGNGYDPKHYHLLECCRECADARCKTKGARYIGISSSI